MARPARLLGPPPGRPQAHAGRLRRLRRPLAGVSRADCEALLKVFQERGCRPNTRKAYHRVLDAFFRWLLAEERLPEGPMQWVPKPELPKEQVKPLTPEELAKLLAQPDRSTLAGVCDLALIAFLADTGLRVSEALALRFSPHDPGARWVSVTRKGRKGRKGRTVFYGEAVAGFLKAYVARRAEVDTEDLLFVNSLGEPLLRFRVTERVRECGKRAGISGKRVNAHSLRHTFDVSWCVNGRTSSRSSGSLGTRRPR